MAPAAPRRWIDNYDGGDDTTTSSSRSQHHGVEITLQDAATVHHLHQHHHYGRHGVKPPPSTVPTQHHRHLYSPTSSAAVTAAGITTTTTTPTTTTTATTGGNRTFFFPSSDDEPPAAAVERRGQPPGGGVGGPPMVRPVRSNDDDGGGNNDLWTKTASWTQWMFYSTNHFFATLDDKHDDGFQSEHLGDSRQYWRDIILGVNDGLVSTFLLVAGVTGANLSNKDILLTAIAGTIAGAISMAAGEYIATKTQEEVFAGEVKIERTHIAAHREQELGELRECFAKIGIVSHEDSSINEKEEVEDLHRRLYAFYSKRDHAHLLVHMALEFGILEDEKRNPVIAGTVAFVLFTSGALPSVLPFTVIERNTVAFCVAGVLTMTCLFLVGAIKTWATRGNLWHAAVENLAVSAGGGAVAFVVGYAFEQLLGGSSRGDDTAPGCCRRQQPNLPPTGPVVMTLRRVFFTLLQPPPHELQHQKTTSPESLSIPTNASLFLYPPLLPHIFDIVLVLNQTLIPILDG